MYQPSFDYGPGTQVWYVPGGASAFAVSAVITGVLLVQEGEATCKYYHVAGVDSDYRPFEATWPAAECQDSAPA